MASNNISDCAQARELLGPNFGPRESTAETRDAYDHVEQCEPCQSFFALNRSIADRLRTVSETQKLPSGLRDNVLAAIDREVTTAPQPSVRRSPAWPAFGSLVAAAAALAIWIGVRGPSGQDDPMGSSVAAAMQGVPTSDSMVTDESESLQDWFQTRSVPAFEIPVIADAQLMGGRLIQLAGYESAAVDFVKDGMQLTYVMAPVSEWLEELSAEEIRTLRSDGYEVALWEEGGTARAVLSPMPRSQLLDIAEQCKNKRIL